MTNVFNPKNNGVSSTSQLVNIVSVVDKSGVSLLNDFISKSGDTVTGSLYLNGNELN